MSTTNKLITGEELLAMGDTGRCELIYGKVVKKEWLSFRDGLIATTVTSLLSVWNDRHKGGYVLAGGTGFFLEHDPDLVIAPNAAFVEAKRVGDEIPTGFFEGAPDLAVEVISPTDTRPEVESKVDMWLTHGCRSCWVVHPKNRQISLYHKDGSIVKLRETQVLEDAVLPGFSVAIAEVFAR